MPNDPLIISVIDSHTEGEPTRVVTSGFPLLQGESLKEKLADFRTNLDHLRSAVVNEPRGHSAIVGALLLEPSDPSNDCAVIFFNNAGYLGMCGHGTIGLVRTLEYLGEVRPGPVAIETVVGIVTAELHEDGSVTVRNVPSYRYQKEVTVNVVGYGEVTGDIAWGGNWFFLIDKPPFEIGHAAIGEMTGFTTAVKNALAANGITGERGTEIDHIEIFSNSENADSRNFVLCPGNDYDRSPCGTGTSAKVACLYEDGKLKEGEKWIQESVIGSRFEASFELVDGKVVPSIRGTAHVVSKAELIVSSDDPFAFGIPQGAPEK
ncbi:MAG: proline racemase family protein [Aridibacter famidurans]|nr:proline racemase family protein [Aridibacter famidurans]